MTTAPSFWQDPLGWLDDKSGDRSLDSVVSGFVNHVVDWFAGLSVADWVLFAIALGLIGWVGASLRAITRLGPIEVAELEHDGKDDDGVQVKAMTAQLREALSRTGLSPPPAVPAGTPQINLIDAIKASPIPQANWIAAIVQLVPRPRPSEYRISGVLLGTEPPKAAARRHPGPCGLRYAVVPAGDGTADLDVVDGLQHHRDAVIRASSEMFLHISQDATGAFPPWARWRSRESLDAFVESWALRKQNEIATAIEKLNDARKQEPFNVLADLQIANLYERCEPPVDNGDVADLRAHAVRRYREVARAWPEVVEARYRLSIAAGVLASDVTTANAPSLLAITGLDGVSTADTLARDLRDLAKREAIAAQQMLTAWWPLTRLRLRTQFEPKGFQRRSMRRTVRISKHCHALRRIAERNWSSRPGRLVIWLEVRLRSALVHWFHLGPGRGTAGWPAYYNAACFDGLLYYYFPGRRP